MNACRSFGEVLGVREDDRPRSSNSLGTTLTQNISDTHSSSTRSLGSSPRRTRVNSSKYDENVSSDDEVMKLSQIKRELQSTLSFVNEAESWLRHGVSTTKKFKKESFGIAIYYLHESLKLAFDPTGEGEKSWNQLKDNKFTQRPPSGDLQTINSRNQVPNPPQAIGSRNGPQSDRKRKAFAITSRDSGMLDYSKRFRTELTNYDGYDRVMERWAATETGRIAKEMTDLRQSRETLEMSKKFDVFSEKECHTMTVELAQKEAKLEIATQDMEKIMFDVRIRTRQRQSMDMEPPRPTKDSRESSESSVHGAKCLSSLIQPADEQQTSGVGGKWSEFELDELARHIQDIADEGLLKDKAHRCQEISQRLKHSGIYRTETAISAAAFNHLRKKMPDVYEVWLGCNTSLPDNRPIGLDQGKTWSVLETDECIRHIKDIAAEGIAGEMQRCRTVSQRLIVSGIHRTASAVYYFIHKKIRQQKPEIWTLWMENRRVDPIASIEPRPATTHEKGMERLSETVGKNLGQRKSNPYWTIEETNQLIQIMDQINVQNHPDGFDCFEEAANQLERKGSRRSKMEVSLTWKRLQNERFNLVRDKKHGTSVNTPTHESDHVSNLATELQTQGSKTTEGGSVRAWTDYERKCCAHHMEAILGEGSLTGSAVSEEASRRLELSGFFRSEGSVRMQWWHALRSDDGLKARVESLAQQKQETAAGVNDGQSERMGTTHRKTLDYSPEWTQFEEDETVRHVHSLANQGVRGNAIFDKASKLLKNSGIIRTPGAIALRWKDTLQERPRLGEKFAQCQNIKVPVPDNHSNYDQRATSDGPIVVDLMEDVIDVSLNDLASAGSDRENYSTSEEDVRFDATGVEFLEIQDTAVPSERICVVCRTDNSDRCWVKTSMGIFCRKCAENLRYVETPSKFHLRNRSASSNALPKTDHSNRPQRAPVHKKHAEKRRLTQDNASVGRWTEDEVGIVMRHMQDVANTDISYTARFKELSRRLQAAGHDRTAAAVSQLWYKKRKAIRRPGHSKADKIAESISGPNLDPPSKGAFIKGHVSMTDTIKVGALPVESNLASDEDDGDISDCNMSVESADSSRIYPVFVAESSGSDTESLCSIPAATSNPKQLPEMPKTSLQERLKEVQDVAGLSESSDKDFSARSYRLGHRQSGSNHILLKETS